MDKAFRYIKANRGIDTEESYPYKAREGPVSYTHLTLPTSDLV